jgi:hypothetical protein
MNGIKEIPILGIHENGIIMTVLIMKLEML